MTEDIVSGSATLAPVTQGPAFSRGPKGLFRMFLSLKYRALLARFGIFYRRGSTLDIRSVRIGGKSVDIILPQSERTVQMFELASLMFLDCYRLSRVRGPVSTVLDVGANVGFFALAARRRFPDAKIHCYEPNQELEQSLSAHCAAVGAEYFIAAVGASEGRISLARQGNSLHSVSRETPGGGTKQVAFADAVEQLGTVDLLKLDCEGAEWDIFSDPRPWSKVRHVTMEYHLWAKPALSVEGVRRQLNGLGFSEIAVSPDPNGDWGFAWARKANGT
jgi:FkbM family methyltransferase